MSEEYNGWRTYETWCVHLWITSEEGPYRYWTERAAAMDPETLELELREAHEGEAEEVPLGWRSDAARGFLSEVDWREIAEALREGVDQDQEGEA